MEQTFLLYYDDEIDLEIANLLRNTPKKRKSQRVRELLNAALKYERMELAVPHPFNTPGNIQTRAVLSEVASTTEDHPPRERRKVHIPPPDQPRP